MRGTGRVVLLAFVALVALLVARGARAEGAPPPVLEIGVDTPPVVALGRFLAVGDDPGAVRTAAEAVRGPFADGFAPSSRADVVRGLRAGRTWLRLRLHRAPDAGQRWFVRIEHVAARITAHTFATEAPFAARGEPVTYDPARPFAERPAPYAAPTFVVDAAPGETVDVVFSIDATLPECTVALVREDALVRDDGARHVLVGLAVGVFFIAFAHVIFLYWQVGRPTYVAYATYLLAVMTVILVVTGDGFAYVWPWAPGWNAIAAHVVTPMAVAAYVQMMRGALMTPALTPRLDAVMRGVIAAAILGAIVAALPWPAYRAPRIAFTNAIPLLGGALNVMAAVATLRRGVQASFFLVGLLSLFVGVIIFVVENVSLGGGYVGDVALLIGAVSDVFWFSAGLTRQVQGLARELHARVGEVDGQRRALHSLNGELRRQVAERSRQLSDVLARLGRASAAPGDLEAGTLVDGRFRVVGARGEGAMGTVYAVERASDGQRFALKVMTGVTDPVAMARFAREAQLAATVAHPNVVSVVDVGIAHEGFLFILMELVEGASLADAFGRYGDVPWALAILGQVAEGLVSIHGHGIVHRDLKPANVMLAPAEGPAGALAKITDFGIAGFREEASAAAERASASRARAGRATIDALGETHAVGAYDAPSRPDEALTEAGALVGTPEYMAPELAAGAGAPRPSSDMFGFGVLAFELLTRRRPFPTAVVMKRLRGSSLPPAPSLESACPSLPRALAELFDRCLSPRPEVRPTAREVALALAAARTAPPRRPQVGLA